jgi:hypothetical protein
VGSDQAIDIVRNWARTKLVNVSRSDCFAADKWDHWFGGEGRSVGTPNGAFHHLNWYKQQHGSFTACSVRNIPWISRDNRFAGKRRHSWNTYRGDESIYLRKNPLR